MLGRRSVTEFNYRYNERRTAQLFVGLALTEGRKEKEAVITLAEGCRLSGRAT